MPNSNFAYHLIEHCREVNVSQHLDIQQLLPWYANGTLNQNGRDRVEMHLRECQACAEHLSEYMEISQAVASSEHAPNHTVLNETLRSIRTGSHPQQGRASSSGLTLLQGLWKPKNANFWLATAAMAMLSIIGVQNLHQIPQLEQQVIQVNRPSTASYLVLQEAVRAGVPSLALAPEQSLILTLDHPEDQARFASYRFELSGGGRVKSTEAMSAPVNQEPYVLDFKSGWSSGEYKLTLFGLANDQSQTLATYDFVIK